MSKYYKVEDIQKIFSDENRPLNWTDTEWEVQEQCDFDFYKSAIDSLPTIEVNDDAVSRATLIKRWDEMSVCGRTEFDQETMVAPSVIPQVPSEDCVDRYSVLAELDPRSYEYKAVKELPSVVPITEQFSMVGEWIINHICPNCGAILKGVE